MMPLKRTPPSTPAPAQEMGATEGNSNCVNVMNKTGEYLHGVTLRDKKKKCVESKQSELQEFMIDMRGMFESFKSGIESHLNNLQVAVVNIQSQNTDITNSVQFMSDKHDEIMKRIERLEREKMENSKYIGILEDRIENFERKSRSASIEIRNIPRSKDENKNILCDILMNLGKSLNLKIDRTEIKDIYRTTTTKDQDRPIVVDFCSTLKKEDLILSLKNFNKNRRNEDKLNTTHINFTGNKKSIYISEVLTYKTKRIFYLAREFAKENNYNYCWTSRGIVYLRAKENSPFIRIMDESVLDELKSKA